MQMTIKSVTCDLSRTPQASSFELRLHSVFSCFLLLCVLSNVVNFCFLQNNGHL